MTDRDKCEAWVKKQLERRDRHQEITDKVVNFIEIHQCPPPQKGLKKDCQHFLGVGCQATEGEAGGI